MTMSPVWTPDGRTIIFARNELAGNYGIWRITATDRRTDPVPVAANGSFGLALSPQGNRLIYASEIYNSNIWAVPLIPSHRKENAAPRPWTSSTSVEDAPQFSPDGQEVAFDSMRSGKDEIWVAARDRRHPGEPRPVSFCYRASGIARRDPPASINRAGSFTRRATCPVQPNGFFWQQSDARRELSLNRIGISRPLATRPEVHVASALVPLCRRIIPKH
jgi:WD40-like Beta Propeller Repeat